MKRSTYKKNVELSINESFKNIIEESFENDSIKNIEELIANLIEKIDFYCPIDHDISLNMSKIHNQY